MDSPGQRTQRTVVRRWHVLCVLGLLVGLLGMHGLAPGGGLPRQGHGEQAHAAQAAVERTHGSAAHEPETHVVHCGHCGDGHVQHADATCASGAVAGGPLVPPLVPDPVPVGEGESAVRAYAVVNTEGARAPPSLSELQLLRI